MWMKALYNKNTENLMEIAMVFGEIRNRNYRIRNAGIDNAEWKRYFISWANEFEKKYRNEDWRNVDYHATIREFAECKAAEIAGRRHPAKARTLTLIDLRTAGWQQEGNTRHIGGRSLCSSQR